MRGPEEFGGGGTPGWLFHGAEKDWGGERVGGAWRCPQGCEESPEGFGAWIGVGVSG